MTFEIIVGLFIITNTCLQLYWFFWSKGIHIENVSRGRKHFTDAEEIEAYDNMRVYWDNLQDDRIREDNWKDFMDPHKNEKTRPIPSEVKPPQRDENGKYDHSEIEGEFDGFFSMGAALFDAKNKEKKEENENIEKSSK